MKSTLRYITADSIYSVVEPVYKDKVLVFQGDTLVDIADQQTVDKDLIEKYQGILVPGFINAHCHLELSHMRGKISTGSGLLTFLYAVVSMRAFPESVILEAIQKADAEMWENGIMAVGDICNAVHTSETKENSKISYHSFVEMFDFLQPDKVDDFFDQYYPTYLNMPAGEKHSKSIVPHAPYSVSAGLYSKINKANSPNAISSIHMLENPEENRLLRGEDSEYYRFFKHLGIEVDRITNTSMNALHHYLSQDSLPEQLLLVHNTLITSDDLKTLKSAIQQPYLVTCPNANLYIENRLPRYVDWIESGIPICIGTDSYSSNWQLSIFQEMKTIAKYQSDCTFEKMLTWATINGAKAIGKSEYLGSLEIGKRPGLIHFKGEVDQVFNLNEEGVRII